jgi:hypothetical protein
MPKDAKPDGLGVDWISYFFKHCQDVSETEMQTLWARVLAKEATRPGAFSRRTLTFLAALSREEAEDIAHLFNHAIFIDDEMRVVNSNNQKWWTSALPKAGIVPFLLDLGVLHSHDYLVRKDLGSIAIIRYSRNNIILAEPDLKQFSQNTAGFTDLGKEIYRICDHQPDEKFLASMIDLWTDLGWAPHCWK